MQVAIDKYVVSCKSPRREFVSIHLTSCLQANMAYRVGRVAQGIITGTIREMLCQRVTSCNTRFKWPGLCLVLGRQNNGNGRRRRAGREAGRVYAMPAKGAWRSISPDGEQCTFFSVGL